MYYLLPLLVIIVDQLTKYLAVKHLYRQASVSVIGEFLSFNFVKNYGAAFGILQNQKMFFIIITIVILIGIILFMKNSNNSKLMDYSLLLIIGGAIGNLIDRIKVGYVIDFIDVKFGKLYDYPVFNMADSFIVVATITIIYLVIFDKYEIK
ncbi:MAG: signal peptidase II [Firmicutes bacterium]|nr:signal peptidase II [Bacillota bacterium]